ncbi:hypothetical protein C8Q70DRAFT_963530 [Cubamyces menziesii]|nr:hypothetical protein C8Q70DRAFT_963530 [Cubamyces menziesii]
MRDLSQHFTPGIIERICYHLLTDQDGDDRVELFAGPRTVVAIALCCRRFSQPALDVLWNTVPDPALLLYTLPRFLSHSGQRRRIPIEHALDDNGVFASCLARDTGILERMFSYGSRVRAVDQSSAPLPLPSKLRGFSGLRPFYIGLVNSLGTFSLFPKVQKVCLRTNDQRLPCCALPLLVGPNTRHVDLEVRTKDTFTCDQRSREEDHNYLLCTDDLIKFADKLAAAKWLQYLRIHIECVHIRSSMDIFTMSIRRLTNLTELVITLPLTMACMVDLAELPLLQYLTCRLDHCDWDDDDIRRYLNNERPFMRLMEANLTVPNLVMVALLLSPVSTPELMILRVKTTKPVERGEIDALFRTIVKSEARRVSIGTIDIRVEDVFEPMGPDEESHTSGYSAIPTLPKPISAATLAPLFKLEDLTTLSLRIRWPFSVGDELLEKIANTWDSLFHLHLSSGYPRGVFHQSARVNAPAGDDSDAEKEDIDGDNAMSQDGHQVLYRDRVERIWEILPKPRLTLLGLVPLLRRCENIETLSVQFDATRHANIPPRDRDREPIWPMQNAPPRDLYKLSVGLSPIQNPHGVADFLSAAFPQLAGIYSSWWALQTDEEKALDAGYVGVDGWDSSDDEGQSDDFVPRPMWAREDERWSMARRYHVHWRTVGALLKQSARLREERARAAKMQGRV